jgi:hypothetical protein
MGSRKTCIAGRRRTLLGNGAAMAALEGARATVRAPPGSGEFPETAPKWRALRADPPPAEGTGDRRSFPQEGGPSGPIGHGRRAFA